MRTSRVLAAALCISTVGLCAATAEAKDSLVAAVSIPNGQPVPVMAENGAGYTPGTYAVGTIILNYTYVGTALPAGPFVGKRPLHHRRACPVACRSRRLCWRARVAGSASIIHSTLVVRIDRFLFNEAVARAASEVFEPDGRYAGRVDAPRGVATHRATVIRSECRSR